jgi:predicted aspartyl protease
VVPPTTVVTPTYPYLEVEFTIGAFHSPTVLAYVDTGFDGYLIIPTAQIALLGPPQFSAPWELGDGSIVQAPEYRGDVHVSGLAVTIPARMTLLGEEYQVGRGVVDRLRMTFAHGQRLLVET